jgi:hypothetical protein
LTAEGGRTVTVTLPLTVPPLPSLTVTRSWNGVFAVTCGAVQVGLAAAGSLKVPAGVGGVCVQA